MPGQSLFLANIAGERASRGQQNKQLGRVIDGEQEVNRVHLPRNLFNGRYMVMSERMVALFQMGLVTIRFQM